MISSQISPTHPALQRHSSSTSSVASLASLSSAGTVSQYPRADEGEEVTVEGVTHSEMVLEARRHRTPHFAAKLLTLLRDELHVKNWDHPTLQPSDLLIEKVTGSLTNAIFFVSTPDFTVQPQSNSPKPPKKVLLRIYGASSSDLISRPKELYMLYKLSSIYRIGPRIFGTFGNGRVEEFFDSRALTAEDMRRPDISRWIGRRMSELHSVDIGEVLMPDDEWVNRKFSSATTVKNFREWSVLARGVLEVLEKRRVPADHMWNGIVDEIDINRLEDEWKAYTKWLEAYEEEHGESERVFAHNDAQYGNLLMLTEKPHNRPNHHQIIVVDFEYAGPNPAAFDIANHFHEWTSNYLSADTPYLLDTNRYPTRAQRDNFYHAYISPLPAAPSTSNLLFSTGNGSSIDLTTQNYVPVEENKHVQEQLDALDGMVRAWSPASLAMWAVWAVVQVRDEVVNSPLEEVNLNNGEFHYLGHAVGRVQLFRKAIAELGTSV